MSNSGLAKTTQVVTGGKATLGDFVDALREDHATQVQPAGGELDFVPTFKPVLPKAVNATAEQIAAMKRLPELLSAVKWPDSRRQLTEAELRQLNELLSVVKATKGLVEATEKALRPAFFNSMDVTAEQRGTADPKTTPRDVSGFYVLEDDEHARCPGQAPMARRQTSRGSVSLNADDLLDAVVLEQLDKEDYLAITRQVRVVDETKLWGWLAKKPSLIGVIGSLVRTAQGKVSMILTENKA